MCCGPTAETWQSTARLANLHLGIAFYGSALYKVRAGHSSPHTTPVVTRPAHSMPCNGHISQPPHNVAN